MGREQVLYFIKQLLSFQVKRDDRAMVFHMRMAYSHHDHQQVPRPQSNKCIMLVAGITVSTFTSWCNFLTQPEVLFQLLVTEGMVWCFIFNFPPPLLFPPFFSRRCTLATNSEVGIAQLPMDMLLLIIKTRCA